MPIEETTDVVVFNNKSYTFSHGSPFDRGSADSWYSRPRDPHWYPEGTYNGQRRDNHEMTTGEVYEYLAGYDYNEQHGDKKDWD